MRVDYTIDAPNTLDGNIIGDKDPKRGGRRSPKERCTVKTKKSRRIII